MIWLVFLLVFNCFSMDRIKGMQLGADSRTNALYHFNKGSGNTAYDTSGNSYNGIMNNTLWINGKYGKAVSFDGYTSYTYALNSKNIDQNWNAFTIMFWYRSSDIRTKYKVVITKEHYDLKKGWWVMADYYGGGYISGAIWLDGQRYAKANYDIICNDQNWHHIAFVWDGSKISIYVDGVSKTLNSVEGNFYPYIDNITFGRACLSDWRTYYHQMDLDEVIIFNKALTEAEIKNIYEMQKGGL